MTTSPVIGQLRALLQRLAPAQYQFSLTALVLGGVLVIV